MKRDKIDSINTVVRRKLTIALDLTSLSLLYIFRISSLVPVCPTSVKYSLSGEYSISKTEKLLEKLLASTGLLLATTFLLQENQPQLNRLSRCKWLIWQKWDVRILSSRCFFDKDAYKHYVCVEPYPPLFFTSLSIEFTRRTVKL